MGRRYRDPDWLEEQYHGKGLTQREIADECEVSPRTIRKYMKRFGIETRAVEGENHGLYGKERSEEVKKKISKKLTDRSFSDETLQRFSKAHQGRPIPDEVRKKISDSLSGVPKSEETRWRMSRARLGDDAEGWSGELGRDEAYIGGWSYARRTVRERDEVCQLCGHDGTEERLEVHHIVPLRFFRHAKKLDFQHAHNEGNLILLCHSCHRTVEWGNAEVAPDIESYPEHHQQEYVRLWESYRNDPRSPPELDD